MSNRQYIDKLSTILFWDIDREHFDAEKYARQIIQRVLEYGTLTDWRLTRNYYGLERIVTECKQLRSLDPMALSFICAMSDTKKEEYRCYHFAQSFPTPWNSYNE